MHHNFCSQCRTPLVLKGRYRAISILGQGGFGRTFLAIDEDLPSKPFRVIKQFLPQAQGTATIKKAEELFEAEAIQLDKLGSQHDQIPSLFAHFTVDNRQYLIQEFIDGQTLADELKSGVFTQEQVKAVLLDILPILKFIHSQNVIHRDIKPENIIRRQSDKKLILVDFGAAKQMFSNLSITGTVIGSYGYTAPEQQRGKPRYSSDLYSLGVTCLELLTGIDPIELFDIDEYEWIWRQFINSSIDDKLACILDKLILPATSKRYHSANEVLADLLSSAQSLIQKTTKLPTTTKNIDLYLSLFLNQQEMKEGCIKPIQLQQEILTIKSPPGTREGQKLKIKGKGLINTQTNIRSDLYLEIQQSMPGYPVLNFETDEFDNSGHIIKKSQKQAVYYIEKLSKNIPLEMLWIRDGSFTMGSSQIKNASPQHEVNVKGFWMGKYAVTQEQWQAVMGDNPSRYQGPKKPVDSISWKQAKIFCQRLSEKTGRDYRLPSEAEWEYACRAGTKTPFCYGKTINKSIANVNFDSRNHKYISLKKNHIDYNIDWGKTVDVGTFPPNGWGLYEMHGNVMEWCEDHWHDNYLGSPTDGSAWVEKGFFTLGNQVARGGAWCFSPKIAQSAERSMHSRSFDFFYLGFRVALSA
ncbi:hypothetical protein AWQ22_08015 [Picosynechococcus sp. PCC 7117]|nr:hypothetical protein AWQ22_08015 [Picosynechococcus sp. PCC 7117]